MEITITGPFDPLDYGLSSIKCGRLYRVTAPVRYARWYLLRARTGEIVAINASIDNGIEIWPENLFDHKPHREQLCIVEANVQDQITISNGSPS